MPAQPVNLLIGADSLLGPRSGVGRMTLEIIEAVQPRPELASLHLLLRGRITPKVPFLAALDTPQPPAPLAIPLRRRILRRTAALAAAVPAARSLLAARRRHRLQDDLKLLRLNHPGALVYHEPNMILQPFDGPTVATVNDLSWHHHPEFHPKDRLDWIARNLQRTLQATRFVAISRFTADALAAGFGIDPAPHRRRPPRRRPPIPPRPQNRSRPRPRPSRAPGPVLHPLRLHPRAPQELRPPHARPPGPPCAPSAAASPLVIIGGAGWGATLASPEAERARQDGSLRLLGHVADADLVALYARAAVFAYVSLYEGFGLPVIEAMATGAPVLASNTTATAETAADAAQLVDPLDPPAIAEGLRRILEDDTYADILRTRGAGHAATFTWDHTATTLIQSWRRALSP